MKRILPILLLLALANLGLSPGDHVPDFSAPNQDGKPVRLSDFSGRPVLVYFYPKDDTPGCTKEACGLRDAYGEFQAAGAVILGISRQDAKSHREFRAKYRLPFDLLTDKDGKVAELFGVSLMPIIGLHKRQSALIGADRKLVHLYRDVDPSKHSTEVLADLKKLQSARRAGAE